MTLRYIKRFLRDEDGATAIEYGLIAALIAVAIIAGAGTIGGNLTRVFDGIGAKLEDSAPQFPAE